MQPFHVRSNPSFYGEAKIVYGVNPIDCTKCERVLRQGRYPGWGTKDLVMKRRKFTQDFKRSLIEQLFRETASPAELSRRYNIALGQL